MFDEISTQGADYQAPRIPEPTPQQNTLLKFKEIVSEVMLIESEKVQTEPQLAVRFDGTLQLESSAAFDLLENRLKPLQFRAQLAQGDEADHHIILLLERQEPPPPRRWWPNAVLFVLTLFSTMTVGAALDNVPQESITSIEILRGLPYALSLLLILGAHELGHYFAARYHQVAVTLPYFIPLPFFGIFGTMGAVIQLREQMKNRKQLFDIGIAGPLTGLLFAVPILVIGIATANVDTLPTQEDCEQEQICSYLLEGNSIFYAVAKRIIHGEWLPTSTRDMTINQLSFAGWTGLLITGMNLIPIGQLDGGHVLYTLLGRAARYAYFIGIALLIVLTIFVNMAWFLLLILLMFFGRFYAQPADDITPLDVRRRALGLVTFVIFILIFVPSPFEQVFLE